MEKKRRTYMSVSFSSGFAENLRYISEKTGTRINFILETAGKEYIEKKYPHESKNHSTGTG